MSSKAKIRIPVTGVQIPCPQDNCEWSTPNSLSLTGMVNRVNNHLSAEHGLITHYYVTHGYVYDYLIVRYPA